MKQIVPGVKLIVGLGNPDPEYGSTYHNVGHQFVSFLIGSQALCAPESSSPVCRMKLLNTDAYMNESGACVAEALKKYGLLPAEALVVHDDSDIAVGAWKFSHARNSGGHRGVQNVIDHLGTNAFWRLRIGIRPASAFPPVSGEPAKKWVKAEKFVLKKTTAGDRKALDAAFAEALAALGGA